MYLLYSYKFISYQWAQLDIKHFFFLWGIWSRYSNLQILNTFLKCILLVLCCALLFCSPFIVKMHAWSYVQVLYVDMYRSMYARLACTYVWMYITHLCTLTRVWVHVMLSFFSWQVCCLGPVESTQSVSWPETIKGIWTSLWLDNILCLVFCLYVFSFSICIISVFCIIAVLQFQFLHQSNDCLGRSSTKWPSSPMC